MRDLHTLDQYRVPLRGEIGDHGCGMFVLPSPIDGQALRVIASDESGWDHVSVSRTSRCPNWIEMEFVRRHFFRAEECAMQLHPPLADYVNDHPYCLHIWRPHAAPLPQPPKWMIGGMTPAEADAEAAKAGC